MLKKKGNINLDFEKAIDRKQDFSMTLEILCEEFRVVDKKKRTKRKKRRQIKTNEVCLKNKIDEIKISNDNKKEEIIIRRRASSCCCSCLCHYYDERSIIHTTIPITSLIKSHSCPSSLLFTSESIIKTSDQVLNTKTIPLSRSLETLFSSVSTRECVCHDRNSGK